MALHLSEGVALPFSDRRDAGSELGRFVVSKLESLDRVEESVVVCGLPRGGVLVAVEVAKSLGCPLKVLPARKLGAPGNPELAIGAVSVRGEPYLTRAASRLADAQWIEREVREQRRRVAEQLERFGGKQGIDLEGVVALVVDDGTATGATAMAACKACWSLGARDVWVAVPVAPPEALRLLQECASEVFCLASREDFQAVGLWYVDFTQVNDEQVLDALSEVAGYDEPQRGTS